MMFFPSMHFVIWGWPKSALGFFHNFLSCASLTHWYPISFLACSFLSHLVNHKLLFGPYIPGPYQFLMGFFFLPLKCFLSTKLVSGGFQLCSQSYHWLWQHHLINFFSFSSHQLSEKSFEVGTMSYSLPSTHSKDFYWTFIMYKVLYMELEILDLKFSMLHRT